MLKPLHLSRTELATYVARQLTIFYPDGLDTDAPTVLAAHMDAALARLGRCINEVRWWALNEFDHLHSTSTRCFSITWLIRSGRRQATARCAPSCLV